MTNTFEHLEEQEETVEEPWVELPPIKSHLERYISDAIEQECTVCEYSVRLPSVDVSVIEYTDTNDRLVVDVDAGEIYLYVAHLNRNITIAEPSEIEGLITALEAAKRIFNDAR